jgi:hypothetical protein
MVAEVSGWLFAPAHADQGQVEISYAGATVSDTKFRRDFLTSSLIDRAVQQASRSACRAEVRGIEPAGISSEMLMQAIDDQVRAIVDQLHVANVHQYVDLPDGVHIAALRRVRRPAIQPFQLERVA